MRNMKTVGRCLRAGLWGCLGALAVVQASWGLVPGPILLSQEVLKQMQADANRQLKLEAKRAKAVCLQIAEVRLCPGADLSQSRESLLRLSAELRSQTLLFGHQRELEAALVFLPARLRLPAAELGAPPISLGPEPPTWTALAQHWPDVPVRKGFSQAFRFSTELANLPDLAVWYYGERHLGLITRQTDDGEFVIGAFVIK